MARNTATGTWRRRDDRQYVDGGRIIIEQADMLDKKLGTTYTGGAYRVRLVNVPGMRTKTFLGETAWYRARNHASDAAGKLGDFHYWPDL